MILKKRKAIELVNNIINDDTDKYIMKHKDPQTFEKNKKVRRDYSTKKRSSNRG